MYWLLLGRLLIDGVYSKLGKTTIDVHLGKISVPVDLLETVWRRSGVNGILNRTWYKDDAHRSLLLPNGTTLEQAREEAKKLEQLALGEVIEIFGTSF